MGSRSASADFPPANPAVAMNSKLDDLLLNDRGFVFDAVDGLSYQLSPTALRLVRWMQEGIGTEEELLMLLQDSYAVDENTARRDLGTFLAQATELSWR
jgi:hypothetical protein